MNKKNVVVIGGGTGTHTVLRGLKKYKDQINISAIVTMADSGGSTGRLRDEFGYLPVGDARMALTALASSDGEHDELLRQLFLYRFDKGEGLSGHNFGNLFLVALTDILGSEVAALRAAATVLRAQGEVVPVTTTKVDLVATYTDGKVITGEHLIDEPEIDRCNHRINNLTITPKAKITTEALGVIEKADVVVLGPGDLYTSVLANCVVEGVAEALQKTSARLVYVCNLMTKMGQTCGMNAHQHVSEIAKYVDRIPDIVLINKTALPSDLLETYAQDNEFPVEFSHREGEYKTIITDLLASEQVTTSRGDVLKRSLIRHDSDKLANNIVKLMG